MSRPDAFALQNSGFNAFLFSEVGTELNGSTLTMLSVLARLGEDPWAEAARWARLPRAAITDRLAGILVQMPLSPQSLLEARATAARIILLLPSQSRAEAVATHDAHAAAAPAAALPVWATLAAITCALALGIAVNIMALQHDAPRPAHPPTATTAQLLP
jgi:hypothetical protein